MSITAHSWEPPGAVTVPSAPMKEKTDWPNLDNGQRTALACGPRKFDETAQGKAVALIHADSGLSPKFHVRFKEGIDLTMPFNPNAVTSHASYCAFPWVNSAETAVK